jgi:hypothetical protein
MNSASTQTRLFQRALSAAIVLSATAGLLIDPAPRPVDHGEQHDSVA